MSRGKWFVALTIYVFTIVILAILAVYTYLTAPIIEIDCSNIKITSIKNIKPDEVVVKGCKVLVLYNNYTQVWQFDIVHEYKDLTLSGTITTILILIEVH